MATTISSGTNPYKLGSPPDFGTLYSGRALEFDGVVDYVSSGNNVGITAYPFTMTCWFNTGQTPDATLMWLGDLSTDDTSFHVQGRFASNEGNIRIVARTGGSSKTGQTTPNDGNEFNDSQWHHLVAVFADATTRTLYMDGVYRSEANETTSVSFSSDIDTFTMGITGITTPEKYFGGKITNVQVWDKVWSLSDVQYAYTHPEKLITHNSAVTSGTTISNLKAWYPCTEGNPRSPQTTVYDGSPKELGSELITGNNSTFDSGVGDWIKYGGTTTVALSTDKLEVTKRAGSAISGAVLEVTSLISSGKIYKVQADIWQGTTSDTSFKIELGSAIQTITISGTQATFTFYATTTDTADLFIYISSSSDTGTFYIDSVSIKEVQMGNHGTTTFLGDELITDSDDRNFGGGDIGNWVYNGTAGGTCAYHAGPSAEKTAKVTASSSSPINARGHLRAAGVGWTCVAGRSYKITADVYLPAGHSWTKVDIRVADFSGSIVVTVVTAANLGTTNAWQTLETLFIPVADVDGKIEIDADGETNADIFYFDNITVKEIGVAAGWTTADAEPLIPQTALMGMSKPMVFDGIDDKVTISDNAAIDLGSTTDFTISIWAMASEWSSQYILYKKQASGIYWYFGSTGAEAMIFTSVMGGGSPTSGIVYEGASAELTAYQNKWVHLVIVGDRSANIKGYINGALQQTDTESGNDFDLDIDNSGALYIGGDGAGDGGFSGVLNELSLFKTALTLAQVQELFNDGVPFDLENNTLTGSPTLAGYWRNDGISSWSDRSANSNNSSSISGSPDTLLLPEGTTSGKDILGFPLTHTNNGWLNLDGNEYVDVADNSVLAIVHDFSIECWFKTSVTGTNFGLVGKGGAAANTGYFLFVISNNKVRFNVDQSDGTPVQADSGSTLTDGDWHHLVGVYNSGTNIKLYVDNGSPVTVTTDIESKALDDSGSFLIGDTQDGIYRLDGSIDEARLYNRALSAAEISKNYKHGKGKHS
jgi:hypothetical protein